MIFTLSQLLRVHRLEGVSIVTSIGVFVIQSRIDAMTRRAVSIHSICEVPAKSPFVTKQNFAVSLQDIEQVLKQTNAAPWILCGYNLSGGQSNKNNEARQCNGNDGVC
jgi:hypothetical protein